MLPHLRPFTRLCLTMLLLGWLVLQVMLPILAREPAMLGVGKALTLTVLAAIPLCVWLAKVWFPQAEVSPEELEFLLMVAAFGFAATILLRWALDKSPAVGLNQCEPKAATA